MVTPFFTVVNLFAGMLFSGLLLNLPIYLTNIWYAGYLPFNSNKLYNRHGQRAQIALIVDERGNLDIEKYRQNGVSYHLDIPDFLSAVLRNRHLRRQVRRLLCLLYCFYHALCSIPQSADLVRFQKSL